MSLSTVNSVLEQAHCDRHPVTGARLHFFKFVFYRLVVITGKLTSYIVLLEISSAVMEILSVTDT